MAVTVPVAGSTNWDVTLNKALTDLDATATAAGTAAGNAQTTANSALAAAGAIKIIRIGPNDALPAPSGTPLYIFQDS